MRPTKVCVIGQIIVDVFEASEEGQIVRFGGAMHAARGLWAVGCQYSLAYIAPSYLDDDVRGYARQRGASKAENVGTVVGCPNILLVGEPRETGEQKYEMVLDGHFRCEIDLDRIRSISADATDVLILPGGFDLRQVLRALKKSTARVHIDSNVEPADSRTFRALGRNIDTVMMSTSSIPFLVRFRGSPTRLCNSLKKHVENILLKENRGGSRLFSKFRRGNAVGAPSHPKRIKHSIGVGDCFDAVFIALKSGCDDAAALAYASLVAAEYACELDPIRFRKAVRSILSIPQNEAVSFRGIRIAWERRPGCNVYIAAPDFEGVDTTHIDAVVQSLEYHNFSPRRPVREHGEVAEGAKLPVKVRAAKADMGLLTSCQILLAVLLFNDPGTLIEIGIALEKRIPVIVYDPHRIASNLILIALPDLVSSDLDEVITRVFSLASAKVA